ncbi:MAG: cytochrome b/b6 domain-containing protein [Coriobacteriales bacterium]|jgi:Ni/Fe-hydrogenase 1 B-type cytochrome subunit
MHLAHYREAHPLPFVITHWVNAVCMFVLILTGFYIHYPLFGGIMGICRGLHVCCGIIITINCIVRVILAFVVKSAPTGGTRSVVRDYKTWLPQKNNRHQFLQWIRYYLFMRKTHPLGAKLGVPQKISYLLIAPLLLFMAWTGFALWIPTSTWGISQFLINAWGVMTLRVVHYFMMFVFIIFMCIHLYLANIEGVAPTKLMFFRTEAPGLVYDPAKRNVVGFDGLGKEESYGEAPSKIDLDKAGVKC